MTQSNALVAIHSRRLNNLREQGEHRKQVTHLNEQINQTLLEMEYFRDTGQDLEGSKTQKENLMSELAEEVSLLSHKDTEYSRLSYEYSVAVQDHQENQEKKD